MTTNSPPVDRRRFMAFLSGFGVAGLAADQLWAAAAQGAITAADLEGAARIAGLDFTEDERDLMLEGLDDLREDYVDIRKVPLDNSIAPALQFDPRLPGFDYDPGPRHFRPSRPTPVAVPENLEELAFLPVTQLAQLVRTRRVSSVALTEMYIERLKRFDPTLHCVITVTEERALAQARRADRELAEGRYRGPLHGIPWGAKDLLAVRGYPTTWGATPFKEQYFDEDATVVRRLDEAGAVLVAKLTMGALANGDVWFGGKTRNPWNTEEGSRGSSAGSSAAVAAGLVGFAIGTETRGSILSPCTRCGATGLRPTFGLVSRHGAMALSWSMDKIGPICRAVEDCALVFDAIYGPDGRDETVIDMPFSWDIDRDPRDLRVGYLRSAFEAEPSESQREWHAFNLATLEAVRSMGIDLVPLELPEVPISALGFILRVEAAAAFDDMTRTNVDDTLVRQDPSAWPNRLRTARAVPAVEYIQANRVRRIAMREMALNLEGIDVYLSPTRGDNLRITNLTGHPAVVVPNGFRANSTPTSVTFCGNLFRDSEALLLARAYQEATGFHLRHPSMEPSP
ncbi:MAG: amidase [Acidobacteriota bacterium]|nr:amidase [Acidobacteriota bacterium]